MTTHSELSSTSTVAVAVGVGVGATVGRICGDGGGSCGVVCRLCCRMASAAKITTMTTAAAVSSDGPPRPRRALDVR